MSFTDYDARAHRTTVQRLKASGTSVSNLGREHVRKTGKLHPLVNPATRGATRESRSRLVEQDDHTWLLPVGVALPILTNFDGTGSMTVNIQYAFDSSAEFHELLAGEQVPLAARYHLQVATSAVQDVDDPHPLCLSEFESGNEFVEQHQLLFPDNQGHDRGAEYQILLYVAGCRMTCDIHRYGLKGHLHVIGDEKGHRLRRSDVRSVLGIDLETELEVEEVGMRASEKWHTFYFQVDNRGQFLSHATDWWRRAVGRDHILKMGSARYVAYWQAAVIGLTEGTLELERLSDYLTDVARLADKSEIKRIVEGVGHIPIGAQTKLPNFGRLPLAGSVFADREDLWPIGQEAPETAGGQGTQWQL
jgi:hypothetical protein